MSDILLVLIYLKNRPIKQTLSEVASRNDLLNFISDKFDERLPRYLRLVQLVKDHCQVQEFLHSHSLNSKLLWLARVGCNLCCLCNLCQKKRRIQSYSSTCREGIITYEQHTYLSSTQLKNSTSYRFVADISNDLN